MFRIATVILMWCAWPFVLSACAAQPTITELASAEFGQYPSEYESAVRSHLDTVLKDPYGVRDLYVTPPVKGFFQHDSHAKRQFGYLSVVTLNAKNSFGAYTGKKAYVAFFEDGKVLEFARAEYVSTDTGYWGAFGQGRHFIGFVKEEDLKAARQSLDDSGN